MFTLLWTTLCVLFLLSRAALRTGIRSMVCGIVVVIGMFGPIFLRLDILGWLAYQLEMFLDPEHPDVWATLLYGGVVWLCCRSWLAWRSRWDDGQEAWAIPFRMSKRENVAQFLAFLTTFVGLSALGLLGFFLILQSQEARRVEAHAQALRLHQCSVMCSVAGLALGAGMMVALL